MSFCRHEEECPSLHFKWREHWSEPAAAPLAMRYEGGGREYIYGYISRTRGLSQGEGSAGMNPLIVVGDLFD